VTVSHRIDLKLRPRLALLLAGGALALTAAPAMAGTTLGQVDTTTGKGSGACGGIGCAYVQSGDAGGSTPYVVPAGGGVITSWTFHAVDAPGAAWVQFYMPTGVLNQYTLIGESNPRTFSLGETATTQTQISVPAGAHLGSDVIGPEPTFGTSNPADQAGAFTLGAQIGATSILPKILDHIRVNMSAIIEPDADHDGFGDETQDACPSDPTQQLACAPGTTPGGSGSSTNSKAGPLVSLVTPGRESIRSGYVTIAAMSVGKVTVSASGQVVLPGSARVHALRSTSKALATGNRTTLKLKIPKLTLRAIRGRLAHHKKVSAKVTVSARSADGTTSSTTVAVRLAR
jgi:hypothetical protein